MEPNANEKVDKDGQCEGDLEDLPIHFTDRIQQAIEEGNKYIVEKWIQKGANVNQKNEKGYTPLHIASTYGHIGIVNLLIEKGTNINEKADNGATPLHLASKFGHKNIVELLIEKDAIINVKKRNGETPLHLAAKNGYFEIFYLLIEKKANLNEKRNKDGGSCLHFACYWYEHKKDHEDIIELLIDKGLNPNIKNQQKKHLYILHQYTGKQNV